MKNECSIVRDLLPLYAEGMLSEDSAAFVKEHLDTCEECRALSAGEELSAPTDTDTEQRTGEAGVLRTLKKKLRKQTWHLCIYQGADAERTFASTDLYAPFQYCIHPDADGES